MSGRAESIAAKSIPRDVRSECHTLASLHLLLEENGCPICRIRCRGLRTYFDWLSREIASALITNWGDTVWLCATHRWDFLGVADPVSAGPLVNRMARHWQVQLFRLAEYLRYQSTKRWWRRVAGIPVHLQRVAATRGMDRVHLIALWSLLGPAVRNAPVPPDRLLLEFRTVAPRKSACPAGRHQFTLGAAACDLRVRSLADPATLARYQQSAGLCIRDPPLALRCCRHAEQVRTLARASRV